MADNPTFQIPKDVIEPIINAHVSSAIAAALGGRDQLIGECVRQVMNQKVDENGNPSGYSYAVPFLTWAMRRAVTSAVRKALEEEVAKHEEVIRKNIAEQLRQSRSPLMQQLVASMTKAFTDPGNLKWRLKVECDQ